MLMIMERRVRLFRDGRHQAICIPRTFELPGDYAVMRKEGDRLVIEPTSQIALLDLLKTLSPIEEDFVPIPDPAPQPDDD